MIQFGYVINLFYILRWQVLVINSWSVLLCFICGKRFLQLRWNCSEDTFCLHQLRSVVLLPQECCVPAVESRCPVAAPAPVPSPRPDTRHRPLLPLFRPPYVNSRTLTPTNCDSGPNPMLFLCAGRIVLPQVAGDRTHRRPPINQQSDHERVPIVFD